MKTLSQIISEGLGLGDKPDYVSVKAMTTVLKKDTAVYMVSPTFDGARSRVLLFSQMCPEERCGKKVVDENNGTYRCEKCNKTYNNFKWAYMVSVRFAFARRRFLGKSIVDVSGGNFRRNRFAMDQRFSK